jgi:hypothetical protein
MSDQTELEDLAVAVEIERFLKGESNGAALFQRLFGAAAEPIPARLLAVVGGGRADKGTPIGGPLPLKPWRWGAPSCARTRRGSS